ncbi:hypothetical protein PILCRDRAFT_304 [Piloderma croceum F 1598]|uniref:Transmembrane protein n=1 Tax=Piloderma croceum (strain F 1598) TaxID=765440 RepID=A0A0C3C067_PILCF|nr:hypothetical protein PILCRDRAFT_304 [Piloderma croceum F 1598]
MSETTWNYTVQDFSPLLTYAGISENSYGSNLNPAWQQFCPFSIPALMPTTVCDLSSVHTTNVSNASVSLTFYGKSIQLFGNVTGGMGYLVDVDGSVSTGTPSGQVLASVSGLNTGYHNVTLVAKPSVSGNAATLRFESAVVTVGTALTRASVNRSIIQDNNDVLQYSSIRPPGWMTYPITLAHPPSNTTYHQINPTISGSITIPFSGDAIFVYGPGWSFHPSTYRVFVDNQPPTTLVLNSSLPGNSTGLSSFFDTLLFSQFNLTGSSHMLTIDNDNGMAQFALDYIEIVTVTPQHDAIPIVPIIAVPVIVGVIALTVAIFCIVSRRRNARSGTNGNPDIDNAHTNMTVVPNIDARNGTLVNISGDQHNYYTGGSTPGEGYSTGGNSWMGNHDEK